MEFTEFPKMARLSRRVIITEKIDGTNAAVVIEDGLYGESPPNAIAKVRNLNVYAQSRTRFITPEDDNYGFAAWVVEHAKELADGLGEGRHFGEWWGRGIQRNYSLPERRFSLFNTERWGDTFEGTARPACCHVVPVLYDGLFDTNPIRGVISRLEKEGSTASPGFMKPEGIVVFHVAANMGFKKTLEKDEMSKTEAEHRAKREAQAA